LKIFYFHEKFEGTKGVIRKHKSKDRQCNIMAKRKRTDNDLQNTTEKNKDFVTLSQLKTGG
jgi:hypothetical protein